MSLTPKTEADGVKAGHVNITSKSREVNGSTLAFEKAVEELRVRYQTCLSQDVNRDATFRLVLVLDRWS